MKRDQAISYLKEQEPIFLTKAKKKGYVCPACNNGMGTDGDGISKKDMRWKCFKCGLSEDTLGLLMIHSNVDFNEALRIATDMYNITIDTSKRESYEDKDTYTQFYKACNTELNKEGNAGLEYLLSRGISLELANKFNIGYCEDWYNPKDPYKHISPRIIIPTSDFSYLARDIRKDIPDQEKKYSKSKVGAINIFNLKELTGPEPIFIVEGEIDALSVMQAGAKAIAIGSTAYLNIFEKEIRKSRITAPLIIALDNDPAGSEATKKLNSMLADIDKNISCYNFNIAGPLKDANDSLVIEPEEFISRVQAIRDNPERYQYERNSVTYYLKEFINGIGKSADTPAISTGFVYLDDLLDGGLYEGLYILGAVSSLGKTTLIHQIADNIARNGNDVLYISLEMARTELMAKSISRHTYINVLEGYNNGDTRTAKTSRGITTGAKWEKYSPAEKNLISKAINDYEEYAHRLYIHEGIGDIGVNQIKSLAYKHYNLTGRKPVIFIDYLQILQPAEPRATDKQNTDKAVLDLKRLSRDLKIPVIAISSFNRENYKNGVSMQSFKESGAIEYGSDVLIGLQLEGAENLSNEDRAEMLSSDVRRIELKLLKNRNGKLNSTPVKYSYYPMFNYYLEETTQKTASKPKKTAKPI